MRKFADMKLFALLLVPFFAQAQTHNSAKDLLNDVYEHTLTLETQHIVFTNTIGAPSNGGMKERTSKGELFAFGEKVRVKTDAFEFLSDGSKAYLIYPEDEEILDLHLPGTRSRIRTHHSQGEDEGRVFRHL